MAVIKISELRPAGSELFQDSESFLNELNEQELSITGGGNNNFVTQITISVGIVIVTVSAVSIAGGGAGGGGDDDGDDD